MLNETDITPDTIPSIQEVSDPGQLPDEAVQTYSAPETAQADAEADEVSRIPVGQLVAKVVVEGNDDRTPPGDSPTNKTPAELDPDANGPIRSADAGGPKDPGDNLPKTGGSGEDDNEGEEEKLEKTAVTEDDEDRPYDPIRWAASGEDDDFDDSIADEAFVRDIFRQALDYAASTVEPLSPEDMERMLNEIMQKVVSDDDDGATDAGEDEPVDREKLLSLLAGEARQEQEREKASPEQIQAELDRIFEKAAERHQPADQSEEDGQAGTGEALPDGEPPHNRDSED